MRSPCCLYVRESVYSPYQPLNALISLMKLGIYIMAPKPISTAYCINPSHQSVCLYVYPLLLPGNRQVRTLTR
jgi:hypothetical protein